MAFVVEAGTTHGLYRLHRLQGCTLFTLLLAGFAAALVQRTGATDLPIGTDMANRIPRETEHLIGMFINQVVLRVDMSGDPDFVTLLGRLRRLVADAYVNQSVPFEHVVDALQHPGDRLTLPLIQAKLVFENTDSGGPPDDARPREAPTGAGAARTNTLSQLDATLFVLDVAGRLRGLLVYDIDLFDDADADSLASTFTDALARMVADPTSPAVPSIR